MTKKHYDIIYSYVLSLITRLDIICLYVNPLSCAINVEHIQINQSEYFLENVILITVAWRSAVHILLLNTYLLLLEIISF